MRTAEEIEEQFKGVLKKATDEFYGARLTEHTATQIQGAVTSAALSFFNGLTQEEIETYDIQVPRPRVVINGNEVSVESY